MTTDIKKGWWSKDKPVKGKSKGRGQVSDDEQPEELWSAELRAECKEVGIGDGAIFEGGDYRQLSKGHVYWLPLDKLLEFEKKDIATETDEEFFDWFKRFVKDELLQTKNEHQQGKKSWRSYKPSWEYQNEDRRIGSWWSSWGYNSGYGGGSELTKKLAIALKAVATTVGVVNDTGRRYQVQLASDDVRESPTSFTSYTDQLIVVSPQALLDTSIGTDEGIETTTAWALHEASHVKYSESLMDVLTKPSELRPKSIASFLHNVLEDMRIESLTGQKFPGFADFFTAGNKYLYGVGESHYPKTYGPDLNDKINAAIGMTKFAEWYKPKVDADAKLGDESVWWTEWWQSYLANKEPIRQAVIRGLEHLAEDPKTKQQMDDLTKAEKDIEAQEGQPLNDDQFRALLKKLKDKLKEGGAVFDPCPSPGQGPPSHQPGQPGKEVVLTQEQAAELKKLIQEEYTQEESFFKMTDGMTQVGPIIEVSRPEETQYSRDRFKPPGDLVDRLKEAFFFRKVKQSETERLLKSGLIDEEQLFRVGFGDSRVFERTYFPEETYTSVTMLVDSSGSMAGRKLDQAQYLAGVMLACLRTIKGVRVKVRAHTDGAVNGSGSVQMFRIWENGDPDTRIGTLQTIPHNANADGFAIDWCAKELHENAEPGESQLLIVLSDGLPNSSVDGHHYGGAPAMDHMRQVGNYWKREGVTIVQIAIGRGLDAASQARMFEHWIGYTDDRKLQFELANLLIKAFGGVE